MTPCLNTFFGNLFPSMSNMCPSQARYRCCTMSTIYPMKLDVQEEISAFVICSRQVMPKTIRRHFTPKACSFFNLALFKVHVSHPNSAIGNTRQSSRRSFVLRLIPVLRHMTLRLPAAASAWALRYRRSVVQMFWSVTSVPRYLKCVTCSHL